MRRSNAKLVFSVANLQARLLERQRDYNEGRPHSSLGQIPPRVFAAAWQLTPIARAEFLNLETVWFLGPGPWQSLIGSDDEGRRWRWWGRPGAGVEKAYRRER